MATNDPLQALIDDYMQAADTGFELCVVWRPSQSNPITCTHLIVNNAVLAVDQEFRNSPQIFPIAAPANHKFTVDWSITPEVPLAGIVIGIINWSTKAKLIVASQKLLNRGAEWADVKKDLDAP